MATVGELKKLLEGVKNDDAQVFVSINGLSSTFTEVKFEFVDDDDEQDVNYGAEFTIDVVEKFSPEWLVQLIKDNKLVFTHDKYGDFDVESFTGAHLSEDNFVHDRRPIVRLLKRED